MRTEMEKIPVALPYMGEEEAAAVAKVIQSGWLTQGPVAQKFEQNLCEYLGAQQAYTVSSCTTGLFLTLKALGVGPGDEVIVPSYSFIATANSVRHTGATPIFADIQVDSPNLNVSSVVDAIGPETRGIILVHQAGVPADIDAFQSLARERNLFLIEDAACAIGSVYKGRRIGSHSEWVVFSFHPRKILTTGEGGAICYNPSSKSTVSTDSGGRAGGTNSQIPVSRFVEIGRKHGMDINDLDRHLSDRMVFETYPIVGYNFRLTDIQAAIGIEQLKKLDQMIEQRRKWARVYQEEFSRVPGLEPLIDPDFGQSNFQTFLLKVDPASGVTAKDVMSSLFDKGIATRRGIMCSHLEPCYQEQGRAGGPRQYQRVSLENSERACQNSLVLPLFSQMTEGQVRRVVEAVQALFF